MSTEFVIIDTNTLIILILGSINPSIINSHKRTSIYDPSDYELILKLIGDIKSLLVLPNIWTEVDNLLNGQSGNIKNEYIKLLRYITEQSTEQYLISKDISAKQTIYDLGLTDSAILEIAKDCKLLITSDSNLSDYAKALNINVFDLVKLKNDQLSGKSMN